MKYKSLLDFLQHFNSEEACLDFLEEVRFSSGVFCVHCGNTEKIYNLKSPTAKNIYKCSECKKRFNVLVNSLFDSTKLPIQKWFVCLYLIASSSKGISSVQLARQAGITQKTAWVVLHKIRNSFSQNDLKELFGTIEIDETYVGGKEKNKHSNKKAKVINDGKDMKTPVVGMVERSTGQVKTFPVKSASTEMVETKIIPSIKKGSHVMTDQSKIYNDIKYYGFKHTFVNHGAKQYVSGITHTNTIEGFWSILKRGYAGIYHYMSQKYLQNYLNEYTFRYNNDNPLVTLFEVVLRNTEKLTYRRLVHG